MYFLHNDFCKNRQYKGSQQTRSNMYWRAVYTRLKKHRANPGCKNRVHQINRHGIFCQKAHNGRLPIGSVHPAHPADKPKAGKQTAAQRKNGNGQGKMQPEPCKPIFLLFAVGIIRKRTKSVSKNQYGAAGRMNKCSSRPLVS